MKTKSNIKKILVMTLVFAIMSTTITIVGQADNINENEYITQKKTFFWNQLLIQAPSLVQEGNCFNVKVTAYGIPIENALVKFDNELHYTNSLGYIRLTAPQVNENNYFKITASKKGYRTDATIIQVLDHAALPQLMLTAPSIVKEGNCFNVKVTAYGIPIQNALVVFHGRSYYTNSLGIVRLTAPMVDEDRSLWIRASKLGYDSDVAWIKVLDGEQPQPIVPRIKWLADKESRTLTVFYVYPDDVRWSDLRIEHDGEMTGITGDEYVDSGDVISGLVGMVRICHEPTGKLLATFFFPYDVDPIVPRITFIQKIKAGTLTVASVFPDTLRWSDLRIEHDGEITGITGDEYVDPGDMIYGLAGWVRIYHDPTDRLLATFFFPYDMDPLPTITFIQREKIGVLIVDTVHPDGLPWSDIRIEHDGEMTGISGDGDEFVEPGEMIHCLVGTVRIYHEPTGRLLATFFFPCDMNPIVPRITFIQKIKAGTLTVVSVFPDTLRWSNIRIEHDGSITAISDDGDGVVEPGENIHGLAGLVSIYYKPTGTLLGIFKFPKPI